MPAPRSSGKVAAVREVDAVLRDAEVCRTLVEEAVPDDAAVALRDEVREL